MRVLRYIIAVAAALTATSCIMVEGDGELRNPKWIGHNITNATMMDASAITYHIRTLLEYNHALMLSDVNERQALLDHIHISSESFEQNKYTIVIKPPHANYGIQDTIEITTTGGSLSDGATWEVKGPMEVTIRAATNSKADYEFVFEHISNSYFYNYTYSTETSMRTGNAKLWVNDLTKDNYAAFVEFDFVGEMHFTDTNHSSDKPLFLSTEIVEPLTYNPKQRSFVKGKLETICTDTFYDTTDEVVMQVSEHGNESGYIYFYYAGCRDYIIWSNNIP